MLDILIQYDAVKKKALNLSFFSYLPNGILTILFYFFTKLIEEY